MMSTRYVEALAAERDSLASQVLALAEKAANETRSLTDPENSSIKSWRDRIDSLDSEIRTWASTSDAFAKFEQISAPGVEKREKAAQGETTQLSVGEQFVRSAQYRGYSFHGSSGAFETRAPIVTTAPPGSAFMTADTGYAIRPPEWSAPLLSVSNQVSVSSNTVEYASYGEAPAAGVVAESAAKPEAALTATPVTKTLLTYAHWVSVSRQALEDSAQLRAWIDGSLTRGVERKLEADAAVALVGATLPTATGDDLLQAIRAGVGTVQATGYVPNAVVLNPADWAALDNVILAGTAGGPVVNQSFWGLRPVPSAAVAAGTAYVGDFLTGTTLFSRNSTSVLLSDSHSDNFVKNLFVVLAERRALYAVTVPEALASVSAVAAP